MITIQEHIPLAQFTTFGIGGEARYFVEVSNTEELREALTFARERSLSTLVFSGGSNLLIADAGYEGLVIHNAFRGIDIEYTQVAVASGESLLATLTYAAKHGLVGAEKLAGIPGTIGGALRGNAGAFGSEIQDFVTSVTVYDMTNETEQDFDVSSCDFSYRSSLFKKNPQLFIVSCILSFQKGDAAASERAIAETIAERERRHLQNVACAGSFFMNPIAPIHVQKMFADEKKMTAKGGRVPAGWLIEKVGLKGYAVGGAMASTMHPNYVMNTGSATAADVQAVARKIKETVFDTYGIEMREEVTLVA